MNTLLAVIICGIIILPIIVGIIIMFLSHK